MCDYTDSFCRLHCFPVCECLSDVTLGPLKRLVTRLTGRGLAKKMAKCDICGLNQRLISLFHPGAGLLISLIWRRANKKNA